MIPILYVWSDHALLLLRFTAGLVFIAHGLPKMQNTKQTAEAFTAMGFIPGRFWGMLAALIEIFGGCFLILGMLTQVWGFIFMIEMAVAIIFVRRKAGLVGGYEFELVLFALSAALASLGGGYFSLDSFLGIYFY